MEFRLLGPLQVSNDGSLVELRAKERTLLAVLLLHANETVSTERLVDELWGEQPPASAAKLVATYIWRLRQALGDLIVTRPPGYAALVSPDRLDTARFEGLLARAQGEHPAEAAATLREALELWRGAALADVTFESSARGDAARLDDQRLSALAQRIDHDLALGRHEDVLAELHALVRDHPFRERYRAQLMLALYRSGRQADALETHRDARRRFVDELGIEPGPELQRLERAILAHDPALDGHAPIPAAEPRALAANLPRPVSSFVGRERELREVVESIRAGERVVTLTGPGGSGKTRLALEAASALAGEHEAGVFWIGLAPLRDPTLVLDAVGEAVGARSELATHIGDREMLLLVDNLEHVIDAAAGLASLLAACPNLRMLVTSRERMRVQGELEFPVPPLSGSDAVSLFCKRAQAEPSPEIEALCTRLDNLPLAVELAAGRAKALSPAQILERLSERLDLLRGGRDADPRQQTLRATIEWSYDLLSPAERRLFARLAPFAGGCTLEAATDVCGADLETLQALVEKSLLRFSNERYWMLATIREYAAESLSESGESDAVMERLARYLVELGKEEGAPLFPGRVAEGHARLDAEHPNVRAAVEWAIQRQRHELVAEFVVVFREVWMSDGDTTELARWTEDALLGRGVIPDELWPHVLLNAERVQLLRGERAQARLLIEEALEFLQHIEPQPRLEAMCLSELSWILCEDGDLDRARRLAERSLELRLEHGLPSARALLDLGHVATLAGDLRQARIVLEEARASALHAGRSTTAAYATRMLAQVARRRGDSDQAAELLHDAVQEYASVGWVTSVASCLRDLAMLAKERGDLERAASLWRAGTRLAPSDRSPESPLFPQEIGDLPEVAPDAREVTLDEAVALASARPA